MAGDLHLKAEFTRRCKMKKHVVELTDDERARLQELIGKGKPSARKVKRANILLLADLGRTDKEIAQMLHSSVPTVERTRRKFVVGNLENALNEKSRSGRPCKLDAKADAYLIALARSRPPAGLTCWTMQLLADRLVSMGIVDDISDEAVRLRLKKIGSSRKDQRIVLGGNTSKAAYPDWTPSSSGEWKSS